VIAYYGKIAIHPTSASNLAEFVDRAAVGPIPGWVVLVAGFVYNFGWLAFAPQHDPVSAPQLARVPQPAAQPIAAAQSAAGSQLVSVTQPAVAAQKEAAHVPPPSAADDYLLAHQTYSPRNSLQGVAPYVRTVSGQAVARTK